MLPPSVDMIPDRVVETHALRDWVWTAMGELSPPLRLVLMLRHFSGVTSYEHIAEACELPVGTLQASQLGEPVYRRMGFAKVDEYRVYRFPGT